MRFQFFNPELPPERTLSVDGVMPSRLNLSHWPSNRTPQRFRADTSTEMALKLAEAADRRELLRGIDWVTNNHFDTDGVLSAWVVLNPEQALQRRSQLIAAAEAGDFEWATTAEAVKFDITVMAFEEPERSPLAEDLQGANEGEKFQRVYERLLRELPDLLEDQEAYRPLWEDEFAFYEESLEEMKSGGTVIWEYPELHLSVIQATRPLDKRVHFRYAGNWRVLTLVPEGDAWTYELETQIFTWFDTVTFPDSRSLRIDLGPLAEHLTELETARGQWQFTGTDDLNSRLHFVDRRGRLVPSDLPIVRLLEETRAFLQRFPRLEGAPAPPICTRQPA